MTEGMTENLYKICRELIHEIDFGVVSGTSDRREKIYSKIRSAIEAKREEKHFATTAKCNYDCDVCGNNYTDDLYPNDPNDCCVCPNCRLYSAAKPLIDYIKSHYHAHVCAIVDNEQVELLEGLIIGGATAG